MVIHLGHAAAAVPAVVRPRRLRRGALPAPAAEHAVLVRLRDLDHILPESVAARVDGAGPVVRVPQAEQQDVEDGGLGRGQPAGREVFVGDVEEQLGGVGEEGDQQADARHGEALDKGGFVDAGHLRAMGQGFSR